MLIFGMTAKGGFDPLVLLLMALIVEAYIGEAALIFKTVRHPIRLIGDVIAFFDRKLNREDRTEVDRAFRGAMVVVIVVSLTFTIGWGVAWLSLNHPLGWIIEFAGLVSLLAARGLYDHVSKVARGLRKSVEDGRRAVAHIVGRDPDQLDGFGVARAAIESLAENFGDGVVAPVFWYVLFGFPGLLVYKAVNTMDSMIGHRSKRYRAFGMTAARLDDVLNLIPARLAGLFIVFASAFVPTAKPGQALKVMLRDSRFHRSFNAGWPEGAMAGALGLALAGPRHYPAQTVNDPWIGDGKQEATAKDISRGLYLFFVACLINAMWVAAIAMLRFSL
ncbi:MAG: cobalamin biosynthesis protein CobD [Alphaproteobacteria bacterium]|jgi:adenosylcobinamide-phosphate synthase|nr:cobalamin biosynthesis protein CobD [Alphaproteobacteria bacterium]MBT7943389.1 cobalamin biosynthesis protein CobD [Alphaproteobacteria bacterium]